MQEAVLKRTATRMQQKLRKMAPMPVGVVFLPWPGMTEEEAREQFRLMKQHGFTCLKQTMPLEPDWPTERVYHVALDEGIIPYWYAEAGWEDITPALLEQLGLDPQMDIDAAMEHPAMIRHQTAFIRKRIDAEAAESRRKQEEARQRKAAAAAGQSVEERRAKAHVTPGVVGDVRGYEIHPDALPAFVDWLKHQYGSVDALKEAWNAHHVGLQTGLQDWQTWEDVAAGVESDVSTREYRNLRDRMRFRADMFIRDYISTRITQRDATDPEAPVRAGGEMGIFLPFASRGTDMEGVAWEMAEGGSFYPSIHLTWHFEEVHFEIARPVYMMAAMTTDWAKGIWSATWESTGGPSYFSGGKSPFVEWAQDKTPGFTDDVGGQTVLMLSWLAAGYRGFGMWTWNARTAGWESGEFALLDRNRKLTPRAIRAGQIGMAARKYRRELWQSDKCPMVGVLQDFDNEAYWAAMGVTGRDHFKSEPVRARIGVSRALINGNIPWEHVTARQLADGLGPRTGCIYVPAFIALTDELLDDLTAYAEQGGRVVLDMPAGHLDGYGRSLYTHQGTRWERLFGVELHEYGYSRPGNNRFHIGDTLLEGFTAIMTPTTARIVSSYRDAGGAAITENAVGKGTAVVIGAQASINCCLPGNEAMEALIRRTCLNGKVSPFAADGVIAYRLVAPGAQHYFLINDGEAAHAQLVIRDAEVRDCVDAVTGERVDLSVPVAVEREGGRWLRVSV
jgi:beta-galactosidase